MGDQAAQTPMADHIARLADELQRARCLLRVDRPDDHSTSSYGPEVCAEVARILNASRTEPGEKLMAPIDVATAEAKRMVLASATIEIAFKSGMVAMAERIRANGVSPRIDSVMCNIGLDSSEALASVLMLLTEER